MKKNNKLLLLLVFPLLLSGCTTRLNWGYFRSFNFIKWVSDDCDIVLMHQGLGSKGLSGMAFLNGVEGFGYYSIYIHGFTTELYVDFYDSFGETFEFYLEPLTKEYAPSRGFLAYSKNDDKRYLFNPVQITQDEIDLRGLCDTDLISKDNKHKFLCGDKYFAEFNPISGLYTWYYGDENKRITLTFGENKSFEIGVNVHEGRFPSDATTYKGSYDANFESVVLNFESNDNIFNESSLELFYDVYIE